jgi:hypothetical protein
VKESDMCDRGSIAGNGRLLHNIFYQVTLNKDGFIQQGLVIFPIDQFTAFDGGELGAGEIAAEDKC